MRTKRQTRLYIAEIVNIHAQLLALNMRKHIIAKKLGYGTWRSHELPGVAIICGRGSGGWVTQWKPVAQLLADRLGLTAPQLVSVTHGHRRMTHATPTVSVRKDKAKLSNPKLKVA